jgi:hypothetical protein
MGSEATLVAKYKPPTPSAPYSQVFYKHKSFKGGQNSIPVRFACGT